MSTEPKGPEPKVRDRTSFQEVAKLASTPEPQASAAEEKKENSGMIDLAALAASDTNPEGLREAASKAQASDPGSGVASGLGSGAGPSRPDVDEAFPTARGMDHVEPTEPGSGPPDVEPQGLQSPASVVKPILTIDIPAAHTPSQPAVSAAPGLANDPSKGPPSSDRLGASKLPSPPLVGIPPAFLRSAAGAGSVGPRLPAPIPRPPLEPPPELPTPPLARAPLSGEALGPYGQAAEPGHTKPTPGSWVTLSLGIVLGALVAAVFFRMGKAEGVPSNVVPAAQATTHAPAPSVAQSPTQGKSLGASASSGESRAVDPWLPVAPAADSAAVHAGATPLPRPFAAVQATPTPAAPSAGAQPDTETVTPRVDTAHADTAKAAPAVGAKQAAGGDQNLESLMRKAVGPAPAPPVAAAPSAATVSDTSGANAGNLPTKPAMGAVQGALGTVLPAARYCLGPDDPVSRATITFKSDGSVQNVTVTGDAAGQPAEGCIRSRLMTARVPPFGSPTFTWTVTVRPAS